MDEQLRFLLAIAESLDDAGISYMVTGSVALAVYATPRMTRDIDLVVELREADVPKIVALFDQNCFIDPESVHRAVAAQGMFNIIHNDWIVKAHRLPEPSTLFLLGPGLLGLGFFRKRVE